MAKFSSSALQSASKNDCVNAVVKAVYGSNIGLTLSQKDRKTIEAKYKASYEHCRNLASFVRGDRFLQQALDKVPSISNYIDDQIRQHKALQPGILAECDFVHTLARILGCTEFRDASDSAKSVPAFVLNKLPVVRINKDECVAARFFYYDKKDPEKVLIQYGNPEGKDASVVFYVHEVVLEIKDMPAVYKDKDLYYDEAGFLIADDDILKNYPVYASLIDEFNNRTCVWNELGHNYPLDPKSVRGLLFNGKGSEFDLLLTAKDDRLVVIRRQDLGADIGGKSVVSTDHSEIRMTGKNGAKVFTPLSLKSELRAIGAYEHCGVWFVPENAGIMGLAKGRGKNEITRLKLTPSFYLKYKDVRHMNGHYNFDLADVKQSKCGISIHLDIAFPSDLIYEHLYKGRV